MGTNHFNTGMIAGFDHHISVAKDRERRPVDLTAYSRLSSSVKAMRGYICDLPVRDTKRHVSALRREFRGRAGEALPVIRRRRGLAADVYCINATPSFTSRVRSKAAIVAPTLERQCQTASHQRSNDLMWVPDW